MQQAQNTLVPASHLVRAHRLIKQVVSALEFSRMQSSFPEAYERLRPVAQRPLKDGLSTEEAMECLVVTPGPASHFAGHGYGSLLTALEDLLPKFGVKFQVQGWPRQISIVQGPAELAEPLTFSGPC